MKYCKFNCNIFVCKICFNTKPHSTITFVFPTSPEESEKEDYASDTDDEDCINLETESTNEYLQVNEDEHLNNNTGLTMDSVDDNIDDFLLSSLDPDIDVVDNNYPASRGDESDMEQHINNI